MIFLDKLHSIENPVGNPDSIGGGETGKSVLEIFGLIGIAFGILIVLILFFYAALSIANAIKGARKTMKEKGKIVFTKEGRIAYSLAKEINFISKQNKKSKIANSKKAKAIEKRNKLETELDTYT